MLMFPSNISFANIFLLAETFKRSCYSCCSLLLSSISTRETLDINIENILNLGFILAWKKGVEPYNIL